MTPDDLFSKELSDWLNTPAETADPRKGIELLFSITGNTIQRARLMRDPAGTADFVRQTLRRHLTVRLDRVTHAQLREMTAQADRAVKRHLDTTAPEGVRPLPYGKRSDHEQLPAEIRELFDINMQARRRMAECHLQIRAIYKARPKCMDSELYPWVKELIRLDKEVLARWNRYDSFKL